MTMHRSLHKSHHKKRQQTKLSNHTIFALAGGTLSGATDCGVAERGVGVGKALGFEAPVDRFPLGGAGCPIKNRVDIAYA